MIVDLDDSKLKPKWLLLECTYAERHVPKEARWWWDPDTKTWWTNRPENARPLVEKYGNARARRALAEGDQAVEASWSDTAPADFDPPRPEGLEYLEYQKAGIYYGKDKKGVLLGDEMGLGKTMQAIGLSNVWKPDSVLIACPAVAKLNWLNEWLKWNTTEGLDQVGIHSGRKKSVELGKAVVIINYDLLTSAEVSAILQSRTWGYVIFDEGHYLKNPVAKRTKSALGYWDKKRKIVVEGIRHKATRLAVLTGTPIPNKVKEIHPILASIDPERFGNFMRFSRRYCDGHYEQVARNKSVWVCDGKSNLDELQREMRASCMVRRLKDDVLKELPPKTRQVIPLQWNGGKIKKAVQEQERILSEHGITADTIKDVNFDWEMLAELDLGEMATCRRELAEAKIDMAIEHIKDCMEQKEKVLVFAHHKDVIARLYEALRGEFETVTYTGASTPAQRKDAVERFHEGSARIFLGNIKASGIAITLHAQGRCSHEVFVELDWRPSDLYQAEDRLHRVGQPNPVTVQYLVLDGTLEAYMAHSIALKTETAHEALDKKAERVEVDWDKIEALITEDMQKARRMVEERRLSITDEDVDILRSALRSIAQVCDGALADDGMGFNGFDAQKGIRLARFFSNHEPKVHHCVVAVQLLWKYRNTQLTSFDIAGVAERMKRG